MSFSADSDPREQISRLEAEIEKRAASAEWCRKIALAAKAAIIGGGVLLLTILSGLILADGLPLMVSAILLIGGTVLLGSNATTARQTAERMEAAEKLRAELIGRINLRVVTERGQLLH